MTQQASVLTCTKGAQVSSELVKQLNEALPGKCSTTSDELERHGRDQSFHPVVPPGAAPSTATLSARHSGAEPP